MKRFGEYLNNTCNCKGCQSMEAFTEEDSRANFNAAKNWTK